MKINNLGFYLFYALIYIFSLIPKFVLYGIAYCFYFLMYYVVKYRRNIVCENLKKSFPNKQKSFYKITEKKFYKHLNQIFAEYINSISITKLGIKKQVKFSGLNILNKYIKQNKAIFLLGGHIGNWEMIHSLPLHVNTSVYGIYKPIKNTFTNKLVLKIRSRFGLKLIPTNQTARTFIKLKNKSYISFFIADQRPLKHTINHWITFLNQDTPVETGPEKLGKQLNAVFLYYKIIRKSKGKYELSIREFSKINTPSSYPITEALFYELENDIKSHPSEYLWSHKRWKYNKDEFITKK